MFRSTFDITASRRWSQSATGFVFTSVFALILNLVFEHSASASGAVAQPTPRPWGKFVPIKLSRQTVQRGKLACRYLRERHGMHHLAAVAVIGHLIQESKVQATGIRGDRGTAFGVAQWRGIRFRALKRFAKRSGRTWKDLHAQLDFIAHELRTSENYAGRALRSASTLEAATIAFMRYERPQGYTHANPRGGNAWAKRLANAAYLAQHGYCLKERRDVAWVQLAGRH